MSKNNLNKNGRKSGNAQSVGGVQSEFTFQFKEEGPSRRFSIGESIGMNRSQED